MSWKLSVERVKDIQESAVASLYDRLEIIFLGTDDCPKLVETRTHAAGVSFRPTDEFINGCVKEDCGDPHELLDTMFEDVACFNTSSTWQLGGKLINHFPKKSDWEDNTFGELCRELLTVEKREKTKHADRTTRKSKEHNHSVADCAAALAELSNHSPEKLAKRLQKSETQVEILKTEEYVAKEKAKEARHAKEDAEKRAKAANQEKARAEKRADAEAKRAAAAQAKIDAAKQKAEQAQAVARQVKATQQQVEDVLRAKQHVEDVLRAQIAELEAELAVRDKTIAELTAENDQLKTHFTTIAASLTSLPDIPTSVG